MKRAAEQMNTGEQFLAPVKYGLQHAHLSVLHLTCLGPLLPWHVTCTSRAQRLPGQRWTSGPGENRVNTPCILASWHTVWQTYCAYMLF